MGSATDELRIAVVFRSDIDIPAGKAEVQFGHAVATLMFEHRDSPLVSSYMDDQQLKLSMQVDGLPQIEEIARKAAARGVPFAVVTDAGRTVFGQPTITCIGLGPMNKTDCNALTRKAGMRS